MILASLLASSKYIIVNKDLIQILGLNEAVILGELCSEYTYWANREQLDDNEYFYSTRENLENNTGITPHFQRIALKNLEEKEIVTTKKKGIPCKTYYKIDEMKVIEYLKKARIISKSLDINEVNDKILTKETTSQKSEYQQDINEVDINNNNNNNYHSNTFIEVEEKIKYANKVFMTRTEYQSLVKTYGELKTKKLIEELNLYKEEKGKVYESDYAAIVRWVTIRLEEIEKRENKQAQQKEVKNNWNNKKKSFDQREYPPGFFNTFYANVQKVEVEI